MSAQSSNASASAYGWEFQKAAGLYMFIDDLAHNVELNIEGFDEDIEITKSNGDKEFAQAKSMCKNVPNNKSDKEYFEAAKSKVKKALETLTQAYVRACDNNTKVTSISYVTNIAYPMGSAKGRFFERVDKYAYDELLEAEKKILKKYMPEGTTNKVASEILEKINICYFDFQNARYTETRYKRIIEKLENLLAEVHCNNYYKDRLLEKIRTEIDNIVTDARYNVKKHEFAAHIVQIAMEEHCPYIQNHYKLIFSETKIAKILELYSESIKYFAKMFLLSNHIITQYENNGNGSYSINDMEDFATRNASLLDDFVQDPDAPEEAELAKQCIIYKILDQKHLINNLTIKYNV